MLEIFFFMFDRFDWQEKLLEKTVKTDIQMQEYVRQMDKALDSIKGRSVGVCVRARMRI